MASITLLLCHPDTRSLSASIADSIRSALTENGHDVSFHDLYRESFDPVMSAEEYKRRFSFDPVVQDYADEIEEAAGIVVVHPDWWGHPPALLKGWIDRVLTPGVAYAYEGPELGEKRRLPLLSGKSGFAVCTTDESESDDKSPLADFWKHRVFGFCGIENARCVVFHDVRRSTTADRKRWIREAAGTAVKLFS